MNNTIKSPKIISKMWKYPRIMLHLSFNNTPTYPRAKVHGNNPSIV